MPFIEYRDKRVLLVHIPKTGGTSIENWLRHYGELRLYSIGVPQSLHCTPQHLTYKQIEMILGEDYFDYACAIVRNPYERIFSEYRMHAQRAEAEFFRRAPKFALWLDNVRRQHERDPFALDNHMRPQWEFVTDSVDIFRFEDGLQQVVDALAARLGITDPIPLEHAYKTNSQDFALKCDSHDQQMIKNLYETDFAHFGYSDELPRK